MDAIVSIKANTTFCKKCHNISEHEECNICSDPKRDASKICVVEDIVDVMAIEGSREYRGLYHVLGGVISPLGGVSAGDLKITSLMERISFENISEVLLALNLSTEGEATMIYLSQMLHDKNVEVTPHSPRRTTGLSPGVCGPDDYWQGYRCPVEDMKIIEQYYWC